MKPLLHTVGILTGMCIFFTLLWEAGCLVRRGIMSGLHHAWPWVWNVKDGEPTTLGGALIFGLVVTIAANWERSGSDA